MDARDKVAGTALLSLVFTVLSLSGKLALGFSIGSVSMVSQGLFSGFALLSVATALCPFVTRRSSSKGGLLCGRRKREDVIGIAAALVILTATAFVVVHAMRHTLSPDLVGDVRWGIAVMLVSAMVHGALYCVLSSVGSDADSAALLGAARQHRMDTFTSAGVCFSLFAIGAGQVPGPEVDLRWIDTAAAVVMAVIVIEGALDLILKSGCDLLGSGLLCDEAERIQDVVAEFYPHVRGFQHMRSRRSGNFRFIDLHLKADPQLSAEDCESLSTRIADAVRRRFLRTVVTVLVEPCEVNSRIRCHSESLVPEESLGAD
jgi:cation diffusion facilitator family transporter